MGTIEPHGGSVIRLLRYRLLKCLMVVVVSGLGNVWLLRELGAVRAKPVLVEGEW